MSKSKQKESDVDLFVVVVVAGYFLFCAWWQYYYVYPPIKQGDYWAAFNRAMDWNPLTPFVGLLLLGLIAKVVGWVMKVWVFLFGER